MNPTATALDKVFFKDILTASKDGDWGKGDPEPGHVPYRVIRGTDFARVREGDLSTVPLRYMPETTVWRRTLEPFDVLIETAGGTSERPTGRSLLITPKILDGLDAPATCASFARFLRINPEIADPSYVFWHLQDLYQRDQMRQHEVRHTGVGRFQYTNFAANHEVELPTLAEQRGIAATLGALDDKIESNRRALHLLDRLFQAHWREVASRAIEQRHLGDIVSTQYGLTASAETEPVGPKFLRVTDINKQNWLSWDAIPTARVDIDDLDKYRLSPGDLVVARMADPGKSALYDEDSVEAVFASYLVRLKTRSRAESFYIYGFLKSSAYAEYAAGAMTGSVQKNMNAKVIVDVDLPFPDEGELRSFQAVAEPIRAAVSQRVRENSRLAALRDALLPELLSGRIRVPESDEAVAEAIA